jgi:hypothetical protein
MNINNKIYEILMGKGKTSTITPLILLSQSFATDIKNFNIVLPRHLVPSSFDILVKYSQIFNEYKINNNIYENEENNINIQSDEYIKKYVLLKKIEGEDFERIFSNNNLFLFDEIDTLIDSNKNDLNIPTNSTEHPFKKFIFKNILAITKKYFNKEKLDLDNLTTYNKDEIILKNFFVKKMSYVIEMIKKMKYNQNYGFADTEIIKIIEEKYTEPNLDNDYLSEYVKNKNNFIAIPYSANNTPVNGSEFTDFELSITLTILSYLNNGLRINDLYILFDFIKNKVSNNIILEMFVLSFKNREKIKLLIEQIKQFNNIKLLEWCKTNYKMWRNDNELINYYLKNFIFNNYFKIANLQYNISMIDIFNNHISHKKIAFSGTVNFYLTSHICKNLIQNYKKINKDFTNNLFNQIIPDSKSKGSIYSAIYGITTELSNIKTYISHDDYEKTEKEFIDYISNYDNLKKYNAIIDCGGLIIKTDVENVIKNLYNSLKKNSIDKTLLYVNNKDERMIYYNPDNIQKYNNEKIDNLLIYYDHKHTVGIDFKQPFKMFGIVSVSKNNTLTQVAQSIYRLRNINIGHCVDFYADKDIFIEELSVNQLLDKILLNEENYKKSTKSNLEIQFIKYLYRYFQNSSDAYIEPIYYDLKKYNNKFINQTEFMNEICLAKIKKNLKKLNIILKDTTFKYSLDKINIQLQLNQNIDIEIEFNQNINIKLNKRHHRENREYNISRINVNENLINLENINNNSNTFELSWTRKNHQYILVNDWKIKFSPIIIELMFPTGISYNSNLYFIYDKSYSKELTILHIYDYMYIINLLSKQSHSKANDIIIYNNYGDIVLDLGNQNFYLDEGLQTLFFIKNVSIIDLFNRLTKVNIGYETYSFINKGFSYIRSFYLFDNHNNKYILDYKNIECWENVFNFTLSDTQKEWFYENIILKYAEKYDRAISQEIAITPHSTDTLDYRNRNIPYGLFDKNIISTPVIEVLDSPDRFIPTNSSLLDKNIIKLYDNENFRRNKPVVYKASPENIVIYRNGIKFSDYYIIKQKILNILSFNGHTNIKIIDADINFIKFTSKDKEGEFIINFGVKSYYEKYLKYKRKYLELKKNI